MNFSSIEIGRLHRQLRLFFFYYWYYQLFIFKRNKHKKHRRQQRNVESEIKIYLFCPLFRFCFLYIPILLVIIYSFNDSRLVTVWGGWSFRWYVELFNNENILNAALLSFQIAAITATFATIMGTMAGFIMARIKKFRGRLLFSGMIASPLVMPEVITGLSLLLLFVSLQDFIGWPTSRGMNTITIAHITFPWPMLQ